MDEASVIDALKSSLNYFAPDFRWNETDNLVYLLANLEGVLMTAIDYDSVSYFAESKDWGEFVLFHEQVKEAFRAVDMAQKAVIEFTESLHKGGK